MPPPLITATNLVASADDATADQFVIGALVCVQVLAMAGFTAGLCQANTTIANDRCFIFMTSLALSSSRVAGTPDRLRTGFTAPMEAHVELYPHGGTRTR